jgi:hypothetical protein
MWGEVPVIISVTPDPRRSTWKVVFDREVNLASYPASKDTTWYVSGDYPDEIAVITHCLKKERMCRNAK